MLVLVYARLGYSLILGFTCWVKLLGLERKIELWIRLSPSREEEDWCLYHLLRLHGPATRQLEICDPGIQTRVPGMIKTRVSMYRFLCVAGASRSYNGVLRCCINLVVPKIVDFLTFVLNNF